MLCERCTARITGGCFIAKGKYIRCNRTEEEIKKSRDILLLSRKLDEIALRYNNQHNPDDKVLWYKMVGE